MYSFCTRIEDSRRQLFENTERSLDDGKKAYSLVCL